MTSRKSAHSTLMLIVIFCAFVSIGFPDAVLGVAWPEMRVDFLRSRSELGWILAATAIGYSLSGSLAGSIIDRLGVGKTVAASTLLVALGLFGYAASPGFWFLPVCAIVVGFGSGAVDTGLNFYAADNYSNKVMNWLHAFFGFGAMIGPFIMAAVLGSGQVWRAGYVIVAVITLALGVVFVKQMNAWGQVDTEEDKSTRIKPRDVLRQRLVWVQIALFFLMVTIEMGYGAWTATIMRERFDASAFEASIWAGVFWGTIAVGRIVWPMLSNIPAARVVQFGAWFMVIGSAVMIVDSIWAMRIGIVLFAFGSAPMFPNLMTLTPHRFGRETALHTIGYQVSAATISGAIVPSIAGIASELAGLVAIPVIFTVVAAGVIVVETILRTNTGHADSHF